MQERSPILGGGGLPLPTFFAPSERAPEGRIESALATLAESPLLKALLDAVGVSVLVLNRERQILVGNSALLTTLELNPSESPVGMRPGEALGCLHSQSCPGGCGTAPECACCGAVLAILEAQRSGGSAERECLMTIRRGGQLEVRELVVKASQVQVEAEVLTVVGLRDISAGKRREALERIFLHDLSNTLGALLMRAELLAAEAPAPFAESAHHILSLVLRMRSEILDQRMLQHAEQGTLEAKRVPVFPRAVLENAAGVINRHPVSVDRSLKIVGDGVADTISTDESILVRVLVNMMKNALEATPAGGEIRAWAEFVPGACEFRVWNQTVIPFGVASQIFKRSFSTKPGRGRGLGTFSMKLLGERYLGGTVGFASDEGSGTTFFIRLPA